MKMNPNFSKPTALKYKGRVADIQHYSESLYLQSRPFPTTNQTTLFRGKYQYFVTSIPCVCVVTQKTTSL
jgi:hypothetical protein